MFVSTDSTNTSTVDVDNGEADEATLLAVRAKLFYLDKDSGGWKERGAGMLKINVPDHCVEFDMDGVPLVGTFDASQLGSCNGKVPRLILRQDQTHKVLLNTAIHPTADFQEKATLRATNVLFVSFEGAEGKAVSITAKVRERARGGERERERERVCNRGRHLY